MNISTKYTISYSFISNFSLSRTTISVPLQLLSPYLELFTCMFCNSDKLQGKLRNYSKASLIRTFRGFKMWIPECEIFKMWIPECEIPRGCRILSYSRIWILQQFKFSAHGSNEKFHLFIYLFIYFWIGIEFEFLNWRHLINFVLIQW